VTLTKPGTRSLCPWGFWECHPAGEQVMVVSARNSAELVEALEMALEAARHELAVFRNDPARDPVTGVLR
jgi:hypothetical protein